LKLAITVRHSTEESTKIFESVYRVKRFENVIGTGEDCRFAKNCGSAWGENLAEKPAEAASAFCLSLPLFDNAGMREPVVRAMGKWDTMKDKGRGLVVDDERASPLLAHILEHV